MQEIKIGDKVVKKSSKPFKSGNKVATVKGTVNHPVLNLPAFTFYEDESIVECRKCIPFVEKSAEDYLSELDAMAE